MAGQKAKPENKDNLVPEQTGDTASGLSKDGIFDTLTSMLAELLDMPKEGFQPETAIFTELPLDSLQLYELVVDLETRYSIHISDEAIEQVETIDDVVEMIFNAKK